jgi:hypothetical protein
VPISRPPSKNDILVLKKFNEACGFWCFAWLGTVFSAGLLFLVAVGLSERWLFDLVLGLLLGCILVGVVATPVFFTVAIATWALWLSRFRLYTASLAGALSWVLVTGGSLSLKSVVVAGVGMVNCALFTWLGCRFFVGNKKVQESILASKRKTSLFLLTQKLGQVDKKLESTSTPWQFTLKDLFVHFTVLAMLISLWTLWGPAYFRFVSNTR